ncbi:MAG: CoB--CoM heterodisulfide reductase iron-sulfur subunit A family protein [Desulfobacterales bacterium]|nr:CoB--CoM heterodisulfide reductase iron-sulfur subunit A family protein [Desulfobacterales bacterium]
MDRKFSTLVAGAGISGVRAALDLAELGYRVLLIDKKASAGGILSQLDYQFPNDHCGMCRTLPMIDRNNGAQFCLRKGIFHKNITFMPGCEIETVKGTPGNLSISLKRSPLGVDPEKCTGCLSCESVCPVTVKEDFNGNLSQRKAIYLPVPHNIPNKRVIDFESCTKCGECVSECPTNAIDITKDVGIETIDGIGSVILATGTELYNPDGVDLYNTSKIKDVVTATAFERIMSSSGPYKGKIQRPSDGKEIKKVAFIQCVGSRNLMIGADYCSSVCCMFALKEAALLAEKTKSSDSAIFCMDLRTFSRDGERYKERVKEKGVRFIRSRIHSVEKDDSGNPSISYVDADGKQKSESFDLVVLSTGKSQNLTHPSFIENEGVFGISETPDFKEISDSMINSSFASSKAIQIAKEYDYETKKSSTQINDDDPKLHIILCSCGNLFKENVDLTKITEDISRIYGIGITTIDQACSLEGWSELKSIIDEKGVNRLIIGACNPQIFSTKLSDNSLLTEIITLAEHISDTESVDEATKSILSEIASSIGRLKKYTPQKVRSMNISKRALVLGGGISGLSSAKTLSDSGVPVTIVEKSDKLGGNLPFISDETVIKSIKNLIEKVSSDSNIDILFNSELSSHKGVPGKFESVISKENTELIVQTGSIIVATGGGKASFDDENERVKTTFDLSIELMEKKVDAKNIVMMQCKDSRVEPFNYCSRICCGKALDNAIKIKEQNPDAKITMFYRDIMAYGDIEKKYTEARRRGVIFKRFEKEKYPEVISNDNGFTIKAFDFILNEDIEIKADLLVYSTGVAPQVDNLEKTLKLKTTVDGFIKEVDFKFRPVDTGKEGIFICGLRRNPANASEAEKEGVSAAQRALRLLNSEILISSGQVAHVRHSICSRCNACVTACPYTARFVSVEDRKVYVDDISCQGCGTCASVCPNNATIIEGFEEKGILDSIEAALG